LLQRALCAQELYIYIQMQRWDFDLHQPIRNTITRFLAMTSFLRYPRILMNRSSAYFDSIIDYFDIFRTAFRALAKFFELHEKVACATPNPHT